MNHRLTVYWNAVTVWFLSWIRTAKVARDAAAVIRDLRRDLKAAVRSEKVVVGDKDQLIARLQSEVTELRHDVENARKEIARLENDLDLSNTALEYQVQWREKEMERLRYEAAIHIRRRIEAVSGDSPSLLDDLGE